VIFQPQVVKGHLAESWEFTDPYTFKVHLRHWNILQDIPPANGREFTAEDVVFHFKPDVRLGSGYTNPVRRGQTQLRSIQLISVTTPDRYNRCLQVENRQPDLILDALQEVGTSLCIENPEAVKKWGDVRDWHHAVGTGPFILKAFVPDGSATLIKNPNYWGFDERYPQNKLPYVDKLKLLIIPDQELL